MHSKALLILRPHIDYSLRNQYLLIEKPDELWKELKARFFHEKTIHLPQARSDWLQLRVLDFADLSSFNAELHRIVTQLRMCSQTVEESEMIDKTLSTFPAAAALLVQHYRNMKFQTHAKLMTYLLAVEKQQQVLLKNQERRPPARETHTVEMAARKPRGYKGKQPYKSQFSSKPRTYNKSHGESIGAKDYQRRGNDRPGQETRSCHKCGRKGHLAKTCRIPEYFVNIYKELQQLKTKQPEAHSLDASSAEAIENYMVCNTLTNLKMNFGVAIMGTTQRVSMLTDGIHSEVALLDSATTHTILRDFLFFSFPGGRTDAWQICKMHTIAGGRDFKYREGRATIVLPGGATLQINNAMYAPDAHRSLISFKDLRANSIHTTTSVINQKEALVLQ